MLHAEFDRDGLPALHGNMGHGQENNTSDHSRQCPAEIGDIFTSGLCVAQTSSKNSHKSIGTSITWKWVAYKFSYIRYEYILASRSSTNLLPVHAVKLPPTPYDYLTYQDSFVWGILTLTFSCFFSLLLSYEYWYIDNETGRLFRDGCLMMGGAMACR